MSRKSERKEMYYVVAPCCNDSSSLRQFARRMNINPTQIRHITTRMHLRAVSPENTIYLLDNWREYAASDLIDALEDYDATEMDMKEGGFYVAR
jgi:hypothetical protein